MSADDLELLELAAKAAGIPCRGFVMPGGRADGWCGMYTGDGESGAYTRWNPLTDDGDALRLAVALSNHDGRVCLLIEAASGHDPCAVTRRAIVRAAVEIGRSMP